MKNCCHKFSARTKKNVLNFTNKFANKNEQDIYLQGLIESQPVKSIRNRHARENSSKHKSHTYRYYVKADGEKKEVRKKAFISLHGVTFKRVCRL